MLSVSPYDFTLRDLWPMYQGKKQFMREHALQQASLVWGMEDLDTVAYVYMGVFHNLTAGRKKPMSEFMQNKIKELAEEAKQHDGFVQVPTPEELGLPVPEHILRKRAVASTVSSPESPGGEGV